MRWVGMDLDGTLAKSVWTPENDNADIGDPIPTGVRKAATLVRAGLQVVIWTSRPWGHHPMIKAWSKEHLPFEVKQIVCGKPLFKAYIDDRNIDISEDCWLSRLLEQERNRNEQR